MTSHRNTPEIVPVSVVDAAVPRECSAHQAVTSIADLHNHDCWAAYLGTQLDDESQKLLAELLLLSNELQYAEGNAEQSRLLQLVLFACASITRDRNTVVAKAIHDDIRDILSARRKSHEKWGYTVHRFLASSNSQRTYIGLGLLLFLTGAVILALFVDLAQAAKVASIPSEFFTTAILFGTLGSSLSIMLRFSEHKPHRRNIPCVDLFMVGFLIVLFFLAGFSERFVGDILSRIEGGEGGQGTEQKARDQQAPAAA
jgi:hypothetical protein